MNDTLHIRRGTVEDAQLLSLLGRTTFEAAFGQDNDLSQMNSYMDQAFGHASLLQQLRESTTTFLIAESDRRPVGYAKLRIGKQPACVGSRSPYELERIYAVPDAIGKGVGGMLMEACLERVRTLGGTGIWLGVWEHNPRAIRFYEKWHFTVVGEHTFMLGNEAQRDVVMFRAV